MRKSLIFLSAFVVSTLVIYSIWYYSHLNKYQGGIVVTAAELPHTVVSFRPEDGQPGRNFILFSGLEQALSVGQFSQSALLPSESFFPDTNRILVNASYSYDLDEKINLEISRKFPGHPPISFPGIGQGDKMLFAYFFQNIHLPHGFYYGLKKDAGGAEYKTLRYSSAMGQAAGSEVSFYTSVDSMAGSGFAMKIKTAKDEEVVFASVPDLNTSSFSDSARLWSGLRQQGLKKGLTIEMPFLDFSITRRKTAEQIDTTLKKIISKTARPYVYTEERMKLKISPPLAGTNIDKYPLKPGDYTYSYPTLFYIRKTGAAKPYFAVLLSNPELSVKLHL